MRTLSTAATASVAILLSLPALAAAPASPAASTADSALAARLDALLGSAYRPDAPGATVIVVKDNKTILRKAYGLADAVTKRPLAPDTTMRIGSLTKQFTATAILMLAEEGKLALEDDITRWLPDYPTHGRKITIEHLLTHTSGIPDYTELPGFAAGMARDVTVDGLIATFKDAPLEFAPGTRFHYDNSGYILLGAIIEKASGRRYDQFVAQRIFTPLGMRHTAYEGHERTPAQRALGHRHVAGDAGNGGGAFVPATPLSMTQPYAAGALVSTVDDLARWDAAIAKGKLLKAASWQRALTPHPPSEGKPALEYGHGWAFGKLQGAPMIWHNGGINGFMSYALRLPAEHVFVAVLTNAETGLPPVHEVALRTAALAAGKPVAERTALAVNGDLPARTFVKIDPVRFDAHAGRYKLLPQLDIALTRDGDRFFAEPTNQPKFELAGLDERTLYIREADAELRFDPALPDQLVLSQNGQLITGTRLP